jgi:LytTr DNA-binding domain
VTARRSPGRSWINWLGALPRRRAQWLVFAVIVILGAITQSASVSSDMQRNGLVFRPIEPWLWEFTSAFSLLVWFIPLLVFYDVLRLRIGPLAMRLPILALASLVFCALHVALMELLRFLIYAGADWKFRLGPLPQTFIYEFRKDVMTFALILAGASAWRAIAQRERERSRAQESDVAAANRTGAVRAQPTGSSQAPTFMVRTTQGDLLVRTEEIDWIEAQGNYVALHVRDATRLLRQTLTEMEAKLKDYGFIRTHRRALVNRERMQAIIPPEVGELGVRLSSGQIAPLSESRRSEVVRLVLGA